MLLIKGVLLVLAVALAALAQATGSSDATASPVSGGSSAMSVSDPPDGADGADGADASAVVVCTNEECSVELSGAGSRVEVHGTPISLVDVLDGRATLHVGNQDVSCAAGETRTAAPVMLECTRVGDDSVEFTASRT